VPVRKSQVVVEVILKLKPDVQDQAQKPDAAVLMQLHAEAKKNNYVRLNHTNGVGQFVRLFLLSFQKDFICFEYS
jgi:hypothetical protein